jgi:hypothetical protein
MNYVIDTKKASMLQLSPVQKGRVKRKLVSRGGIECFIQKNTKKIIKSLIINFESYLENCLLYEDGIYLPKMNMYIVTFVLCIDLHNNVCIKLFFKNKQTARKKKPLNLVNCFIGIIPVEM